MLETKSSLHSLRKKLHCKIIVYKEAIKATNEKNREK